ncbi:SgcJ/EcaC family oxidoreductase [Xanthomonas euroxanthea]|uniref:SgcJ/EcaC family oxidoreductase n=1 Tax=Xanthomonas euroxanthea TaxID=2259622 RepID=UPI001AFC7979|nr:SgcJ/EcaC family oxidoreductase [Xanthomonas euroxanthea]CAG2094042.1 SgcJ/EcaC family oxidoreductase [Xanthomonas euroxanthea]
MRRTFLSLVLALAATPALAGGAMHYTDKATLPADGEAREVAALFDTWNAALATGNPHKVADLYAPDGVLLPTVSNEVRASRAQIEKYFAMFLTKKPQGVVNYRTVRVLDDDSAVDAGVYTFTLTDKDGKKSKVQARYTFVYEKRDDKWLIINHHSSAMPEVDAPKLAKAR